MADTCTQSGDPRRLSELLARNHEWSLSDRLHLIYKLAAQVRTLHGSGRAHCAISADTVFLDERLDPRLGPPAPARRFGEEHSDPEFCPPELAGGECVELPSDIEAAAVKLRDLGHKHDSRRVDVYQLGSLLCMLVTGRSVLEYMYSSLAKASVPPLARDLVSRALGWDDVEPYADCDQFLEALENILRRASAARTSTPFLETPVAPGGSVFGPGVVANGSEPGDTEGQADQPAHEPPFQRLGHFRVIRQIGGGGMGDVYLAHDELLDRQVALKVLPPKLARDKAFVRRFQAEASAAAKVAHPNVVPVHFNGEDAGYHFFAMQYIEGQSLAQHLALQQRFSLDEALRIVEHCLAGLAAAHAQGLVHRDIKPGNVLLENETGRAVLVDFGLARIEGKGFDATTTGTVMGTVDYIAPEQVQGRQADNRADIYALGILLYQLLSGRLPFEGETPAGIALKHAYEEPLPVHQAARDIPRPVSDIVHQMIARDRADRYRNCADVLADIQAFREGRPIAAVGEFERKTSTRLPALAQVGELLREGEILESASQGWRQQIRGWVRFLTGTRASQLMPQLRRSIHQTEMEVNSWERRRDDVAKSLDDASGIAARLSQQAQMNLDRAADAAQEAESAANAEQRQAALARKLEFEEDSDMVQRQEQEQLRHVEELDRQLGEIDATLARLHSQCDVLKSRLLATESAPGLSAVAPRARRRWLRLAVGGGGLLVLALSLLAGIWLSRPDPSTAPRPAPPPVPRAFLPLGEVKQMFDSYTPGWTVQRDGDGDYLTGLMGGSRWPTKTKKPCQAAAVEFGFAVRSERHHFIHIEVDGVRYSYSRGHWNNLGTRVCAGGKEASQPGIVTSPDQWCSQAVTLKDDTVRFYYNGEYVWGTAVPKTPNGTHVVHVGFGSHNTTVCSKDFFLQHR